MLEYAKCNICGSSDYKTINTCKITKKDADIPQKKLNLTRCSNCGLVFLNPRPALSAGRLKDLYSEDYYENEYMRFYGEGKEEEARQTNENFPYRLSLIERYKKGGRLVDIGCATGGFLRYARDNGWKVQGVELSEWASGVAVRDHNLSVFNGTLEEAGFENEYFDVVCAGDVLEHTDSPKGFLEEVHRILNNEGLLYLAFPNAESFYYKLFSLISRYNHKNYFVLPHHIYHFSRTTAELLLTKTGFEIVEIKYSRSHNDRLFLNILNVRDRLLVIARKRR